MFLNKVFLFFLLSFSVVKCDWHREVFYQEINKFRNLPIAYRQNNSNVVIRCSGSLDETYPPLQFVEELENSSYFQASTLSSNECPVISHETCDLYCHEFGGSCSYMDRIEWFLQGKPNHNVLEILIKGPKNPYKMFQYFLESEAHCNHILNCHINSMGASFSHIDKNVFVADFAYINH